MSKRLVLNNAKKLVAYEDKNKPLIELYFPDGSTIVYPVGKNVRGFRNDSGRPIGIKWFNIPEGYEANDELRNWLVNELAYVFDHRVHFMTAATEILKVNYDRF